MKRAMCIAAVFVLAALAGAPTEQAHLPLAKVVNTEKLISTQLAAMFPEEPWFLIGQTRGMYLDGIGVIFSAEINLATGPSLSPFKQTITREEITRHHDKKEARLPVLRKRMYEIVGSMASYMETLPRNEEFVFAITLLKYPWEETAGMPSQIIMRAPRGKLVEAQRINARPETVIRMQEY